jgi:hypothetical protein
MVRSDLPTVKMMQPPTILVIGCSVTLAKRCTSAAIAAQALLVECDVVSAATYAAKTRPLAMVMLEDVYAFDAASFDALAADVRAQLVRVPDERVSQKTLDKMIVEAIVEAEIMRDNCA